MDNIKVSRRGRFPKFSEALFERVLENISEGHRTRVAIRMAGITPPAFYRNLGRHPKLKARFVEAQRWRDYVTNVFETEAAMAALFQRGVVGWEEPVFSRRGKMIRKRKRHSDRCLLHFLRLHKPEVYGRARGR